MSKPTIHKRIILDARNQGQTQYEYEHSTICGYVRDHVSFRNKAVTCKACLKRIKSKNKK